MKLRVFVSGVTEFKGLPRLFEKLLKEVSQSQYHDIIITKPANGKNQFLNKLNLSVKYAFNASDLKYIFTLEDSDKEKVGVLESIFYSKVSQEFHDRFTPHFAVHEIETWILSDKKLLEKAGLRNVTDYIEPEKEINNVKKPSIYLDELFRASEIGKYKKTIDGVNLLGDLNIETVYKKCPSFKNFIDDILKALNIENIYNI